MRVLVACEFSGIVRNAFLKHGHNAWSCDLLPAEDVWLTANEAVKYGVADEIVNFY